MQKKAQIGRVAGPSWPYIGEDSLPQTTNEDCPLDKLRDVYPGPFEDLLQEDLLPDVIPRHIS